MRYQIGWTIHIFIDKIAYNIHMIYDQTLKIVIGYAITRLQHNTSRDDWLDMDIISARAFWFGPIAAGK